jgi:hypothetical protein
MEVAASYHLNLLRQWRARTEIGEWMQRQAVDSAQWTGFIVTRLSFMIRLEDRYSNSHTAQACFITLVQASIFDVRKMEVEA